MKRQGSENRGQRSEIRGQRSQIKSPERMRVAELLRRAITPVGDEPAPTRDLWSAMRQKLREPVEAKPVEAGPLLLRVPWFDWALAAGLLAFLLFFPFSIPVILYYL